MRISVKTVRTVLEAAQVGGTIKIGGIGVLFSLPASSWQGQVAGEVNGGGCFALLAV